MEETRIQSLISRLGLPKVGPPAAPADLSVGVSSDGTVSAVTPQGVLVVELSGTPGGRPEVITSVQTGIAGLPTVLARYPLRSFLALVLHAMRSPRVRRRRGPLALTRRLPRQLRRAQQLALAHFVGVNFDALMLLAHARQRRFGFA